MKNKILLTVAVMLLGGICLYANIEKGNEPTLQREAYGFDDLQFNRVSNIEFCLTNTGSSFLDNRKSHGTGMWPRGSQNCYIYGGGIWVGTQKRWYIYDTLFEDGKVVSITPRMKIKDIWEYTKWDREHPVLAPNGIDTLELKSIVVVDTIWERAVDTTRPNKLVAASYVPHKGTSTMSPGRIEDGDAAIPSQGSKYRIWFSLDYNPTDGSPLLPESAPAWPIWDNSSDSNDVLKYDRYFGHFIANEDQRTTATYPRGPAFISGEDIFCTYKDTDLSRYNDFAGVGTLSRKGYPQRVQYEQMIYSWGFGDYKDFIFIKYDQINRNTDTLWDMWLAPVFDVDITLYSNYQQGANNDVTCFYGKEGMPGPDLPPDSAKATKNMAYQYSMGDAGEQDRGFGYVGFVFLESPAIIKEYADSNRFNGQTLYRPTDSMGFTRRDTRVIWDTLNNREKTVRWYPVPEQLGLCTFRNWPIDQDKKVDEDMYNFISAKWKDGPGAPGDMRYMMATGPFNLRPHDTARTVVGLVIAATGKGGDADGTDADLTELVRKVDFMQKVYDENFRAPQPPARAVLADYTPLNNGMLIHWDSTSELSTDAYEKGMDFLGYKIYRARRLNLDTFSTSDISASSKYPAGRGPYGWKEIKSYQMPTPFLKSAGVNKKTGVPYGPHTDSLGQMFAGIDSFIVVGPKYDANGKIDLNRILAMRVPQGVHLYYPQSLAGEIFKESNGMSDRYIRLEKSGWYGDSKYGNKINAVIVSVDSVNAPWGEFFYKHSVGKGLNLANQAYYYTGKPTGNFLIDSVMLVEIELNPSLAKLNPLFYKQRRVNINVDTLTKLLTYSNGKPAKDPDHWIIKDSMVGTAVVPFMVRVDTLYEVGTEQQMSGGTWTISVLTLIDTNKLLDTMLRSVEHYNFVMDSLYEYISKGWVKEIHQINWTPNELYKTDFPASDLVKREVIVPYMTRITNNRTFVDIGDDPDPTTGVPNAYLSNNEDDVTKTERLFNNVEYYYRVLAFDEGDYMQPTNVKYNEGLQGLPNLQKTYPAADRGGSFFNYSVEKTEGMLGGLFNFKLYAIDEQRAAQLFAGHTFVLNFEPISVGVLANIASVDAGGLGTKKDINVGIYAVDVKLTDSTTGEILYSNTTQLEVTPGRYMASTTYVDYSGYRTGVDTLIYEIDGTLNTLGKIWSRMDYPVAQTRFHTGTFEEPNFTYAINGTQNKMWGNIGFSFDAAIKQFGGMYRGDSIDMMGLNVSTNVVPLYFFGINKEEAEQFYLDSNTNRRPQNAQATGNLKFGTSFNDSTKSGNSVLGYTAGNYTSARFDNGPGTYTVEFLPGGTEELDLYWQYAPSGGISRKIKVPYLNIKITDEFSYNRPNTEIFGGGDSIKIQYSPDIKFMELPVQPNPISVIKNNSSFKKILTPNPLWLPFVDKDPNDFYRHYNMYAEGYANSRNSSLPRIRNQHLTDEKLTIKYGGNEVDYLGTQGRYYLTTIDNGDTLDFVHTLNIAGAQFVLSYFERGVRADGFSEKANQFMELDTVKAAAGARYKSDFKAGDKIKLMSWGGASGFPEKGAKVVFKVAKPSTAENDNTMDEIQVVPNPYVISHQQQKSAYDAQLMFTRLPKVCTINIFSAAGDLVQTIEHNENLTGTRHAVDIWDLITKNGQRMQSQTLVAVIKTPDGAQTVKQFSVIVGGFRVFD